jgi:hypothetical protein
LDNESTISNPPSYRSKRSNDNDGGENSRLVEAFGGDSDDENDNASSDGRISLDDWDDDRNIDSGAHNRHLTTSMPSSSSSTSNGRYQAVAVTGQESHSDSAPLPTASRGSRFTGNLFSSWRGFRQNATSVATSNNDGVFANLSAKPDISEKPDGEHPPTYEEAAADATPPYWETTILASGMRDELFIE